jgi:hypothetical protein
MKELRLMIPGPVEISTEVLEEMKRPLVAHYGGEWTAFYNETLDLLRQVFGTRGEIVLFPGSGSAGLDATFGSTLFPDGKVLPGGDCVYLYAERLYGEVPSRETSRSCPHRGGTRARSIRFGGYGPL